MADVTRWHLIVDVVDDGTDPRKLAAQLLAGRRPDARVVDMVPDLVDHPDVPPRPEGVTPLPSAEAVYAVFDGVPPEFKAAEDTPEIRCTWNATCQSFSTFVTVVDGHRLAVCSRCIDAAVRRGYANAGRLTDPVHHDLWDRGG